MASGDLSRVNITTAATNTSVYTVPASKIASFTVSVTNRNATQDAQLQLALSSSGTPAVQDYIEFNTVIPAYGTYERTGLVANSSMVLVANSTVANLSVVVFGFEDTAT